MSDGAALELGAVLEGEIRLPVLVLGNSIGTSTALWEPQLAVLGARFRLLRFDWPGHGGPEADAPPPGPYSIGALGRGVLALLDRYEIREAAYAGVSLGGMVGMWVASHARDRIKALALCCTSAYLDLDWAQRAATVRSQGMGPVADRTADRWFTRAYQHREPGVVSRIVGEMREVTPEGYAGCCDAIGAMDQRPDLPAITAPTLVIAGNEDPATPPWHGAVIARGIPDARLAVVRGASHLANVSQPGEVTALLAGHLAG